MSEIEEGLEAELQEAKKRLNDVETLPASRLDPIYAIRLAHWQWRVCEIERRILACRLDQAGVR